VRIAIVSDIHGNLTAFEAVLADLGQTSPDLVLHGGDLVHGAQCRRRSSIVSASWVGKAS
jgi:predicted phosphodiesterase